MTAGGVDAGPDKDSVSVPPIDTISLFSDSYITSLVPQNGSSLAILKNIEPKDGQERRYSTGNVAVPYAKVKILSRYLAASSGSCHDLCKYGAKHPNETETKRSMFNRITQGRKKCQHMRAYISLTKSRKTLAVSAMLSPGSKSLKPDTAAVTNRGNAHSRPRVLPKKTSVSENGISNSKPKFPQSKPSSSIKHGSSGSKEDSTTQSTKRIDASLVNSHEATDRERTELQKVKPRTSFHSERKSTASGTVSLSSMKTYKNVLMQPPVSLSGKGTSKGLLSMNARRTKNRKLDFPVNRQFDVGKILSEPPSCEGMPERILHVIGSKSAEKTMASSENSDQTTDLSALISSFPKDKSFRHARDGVQNARISRLSTKGTSGRTQKGIHVTQRPPLSKGKHSGGPKVSGPSLASHSPCHNIASSKCGETESRNRFVKETMPSRTRSKNGAASNTKAKDFMTRNIRVWKPKKVEPQPNMAPPRRLRFRRPVFRENQSSKEGNRKIALRKVKDAREVNISEAEREKVILKHKEWEEKNEKRILLNNMIAETANKLVETRKGKVKALVNAFETVFSSQDSRI